MQHTQLLDVMFPYSIHRIIIILLEATNADKQSIEGRHGRRSEE